MSGAFQYKPKFVDIRIRPPKDGEEAEPIKEDVLRLKPGEKPCDWPECAKAGSTRAPKSRETLNEFYWFCQAHAGEYNKSWNFFAGMSEGEAKRWQEDATTGHRPTWAFRASRFSREASAKLGGKAYRDPSIRAPDDVELMANNGTPVRHMGKIERQAFADLDLEPDADAATIRARYTEMLKRCHPDANGGDRSAEAKLQRVIKAYKVLKKIGLA
jgi:hypothetical protein